MHNPWNNKPRLYFSGITILLLIFYKGFNVLLNWHTPCIYSNVGDALPSAEDLSFSPSVRSIFFHETTCRGELTPRQACSVEAAARAHPQWQVYVLFSSSVTQNSLKTSTLAKLLEFKNVNFARLHVAEFSKGTGVQSVLLNDLKRSLFPVHHSADILRVLTLNKWGGIYLDMDMIVTRSLENLPINFVAKENQHDIASGILSFAKDDVGTKMTNAFIKEVSREFNPRHWNSNGALAIEYVIRDLCPKLLESEQYKSDPISICKGLYIFDRELFYPTYFTNWDEIFKPPDNDDFDLERPYTYHMWNAITNKHKISNNTLYEIVAKNFCPTIHQTYREEFGG